MKGPVATARPASRAGSKTPPVAAHWSRSEHAARTAGAARASQAVAFDQSAEDAGPDTFDALRVLHIDPGNPLSPNVRDRYERQFSVDFGAVRVHTTEEAARSARSIGASAFAYGSDIVFDSGRYAPQTPGGQRLLAHELTHVAQHALGAPALLYRDVDPTQHATVTTAAPEVTLSVSLSGIDLTITGRYRSGLIRRLMWELVLRRLVGSNYSDALLEDWMRTPAQQNGQYTGQLASATAVAADGEQIQNVHIDAPLAREFLNFLSQRKIAPDLTEEQLTTLRAALVAAVAWSDIKRLANELGTALPPWFNEYIFDRMVASQGKLLAGYEAARVAEEGNTDPQQAAAVRTGVVDALTDLIDILNESALILEQVRTDPELAADPKVGSIYSAIRDTSGGAATPTNLKDVSVAVLFLRYLDSVPGNQLEAAMKTASRRGRRACTMRKR